MRNIIVCQAAIILWIQLSSLTVAEYSGSIKDGYGRKSGFDSSYNGYLGEYAAHLSAGKVLDELHDFSESSQLPPEHGSQFDESESHKFSESFGEHNDDEDSSHFDRYSGSFESLKFPQDVEAHHYSGGVSSEIGHENNNHNHHHNTQHHFENHHNNYQFDEPAKSSDYKGYHSFEGTQIVPYSGSEESEQHEEPPPQYSGYEHSEENEIAKVPEKSYEATPKVPASSYSHSFEASEAPSASYSHSYEDSKASKASPSSYSHFYEASKPSSTAISSQSHSYESSKIPASSSYSHSFEPSPKTPSSSYEFHKSQSLSHESPSLGSYGSKYYHHASAQEAPSKLQVIHKFKSSGLKDFHLPLQKNIMTINHGKGGYSFSSLYRS